MLIGRLLNTGVLLHLVVHCIRVTRRLCRVVLRVRRRQRLRARWLSVLPAVLHGCSGKALQRQSQHQEPEEESVKATHEDVIDLGNFFKFS